MPMAHPMTSSSCLESDRTRVQIPTFAYPLSKKKLTFVWKPALARPL